MWKSIGGTSVTGTEVYWAAIIAASLFFQRFVAISWCRGYCCCCCCSRVPLCNCTDYTFLFSFGLFFFFAFNAAAAVFCRNYKSDSSKSFFLYQRMERNFYEWISCFVDKSGYGMFPLRTTWNVETYYNQATCHNNTNASFFFLFCCTENNNNNNNKKIMSNITCCSFGWPKKSSILRCFSVNLAKLVFYGERKEPGGSEMPTITTSILNIDSGNHIYVQV